MSAHSAIQSHLTSLRARYPQLETIAANMSWLTFDRLIRLGAGLLVGAWVARYLGPENFGLLNRAAASVGILGVFANLGLDGIVKGELIRRPTDRRKILGTAFVLKAMAGIFCFAGVFVFTGISHVPHDERWLLLILSSTLVLQACSAYDLWFQATLLSRLSVFASNIGFLASVVLRVALVLAGGPVTGFAAAIALEVFLAGALFIVFYQQRNRDLGALRIDLPLARSLLARGLPMLLSTFSIMIYMRIDLIMLGRMAGDTTVGIYAAAARISEVPYFIPTILGMTLYPSIVRTSEKGEGDHRSRMQIYFRVSTAIAYLITLGTVFLAPLIVRLLFGDKFGASAPILVIHIWALVFIFLSVARDQYLVAEGLFWFNMLATTTGAICNILLNLALIPRFGGEGAAVATVISYAISGVLSSFCYRPVWAMGLAQAKALLWPIPSRGART